MRDTKERNELTSRSHNNKYRLGGKPARDNQVSPVNDFLRQGSDVADLSNAIPVIQQPSTNQDAEEEQVRGESCCTHHQILQSGYIYSINNTVNL